VNERENIKGDIGRMAGMSWGIFKVLWRRRASKGDSDEVEDLNNWNILQH